MAVENDPNSGYVEIHGNQHPARVVAAKNIVRDENSRHTIGPGRNPNDY